MTIKLKTDQNFTTGWHALVAGLLIGGLLGAVAMHRAMTGPTVPETPAPAVVQADGSLILGRKPDAGAQPAHATPAGASVLRIGKIVARARPAAVAPGDQAAADRAAAPDCPPVTIDWSLVREASGQRMIVSSQDGEILGGVDIPVAQLAPAHRWASGISYGFAPQAYGAWLERDVWRLRFGVEANRTRQGDVEGRVRLGVTF